MKKPRIGITAGDINGIGLEVILKSLQHEDLTNLCTPIIYASSKVVSYHKNIVDSSFKFHAINSGEQADDGKVNVVNCWRENINIELGKPTEASGKCAFQSLEWASRDLDHGLIDALVTAPINKAAMRQVDFPFPGHTEYLTEKFGEEDSLMFMISENLRIGLVTNHLPISRVAEHITPGLIRHKIRTMHHCLRMDFGLERPTIAVLALNPHAGDGGVIGMEDDELVRPTVEAAKEDGILAFGPYAADGFFGSGQHRKFDAVLAMYHDQGLIPFKALSFGQGVNYTAGLRAIRTSPDHGTAYDLAGKNEADPKSFQQALFLALSISKTRADFLEMYENPLQKRAQLSTNEADDEELVEDEEG